ncbi:MAG: hypothetical protein IKN36_01670, partial [Clostridia bacterium]|nr:hypothetical protein [Clostridia bacterium]
MIPPFSGFFFLIPASRIFSEQLFRFVKPIIYRLLFPVKSFLKIFLRNVKNKKLSQRGAHFEAHKLRSRSGKYGLRLSVIALFFSLEKKGFNSAQNP